MMLEITIEHAVTKPMVRFGSADLTAAGWVSVVIRREFYHLSYSRTPNIQDSTPKIERKATTPFQVAFRMLW
jgi:hypothetical protein